MRKNNLHQNAARSITITFLGFCGRGPRKSPARSPAERRLCLRLFSLQRLISRRADPPENIPLSMF